MAQNGIGQHGFSALFNFATPDIEKRLNSLLVEMEGPQSFYGSMGTASTPKKPFKQINYITNHVYNVSFGSITASGETIVSDRPTIGASTVTVPDFGTEKGILRPCVQYARMTFSIPELVLDGLDAEDALAILDTRIMDQAEVLARIDNSSWWGDGSGVFAEVQRSASAAATSLKLKRDDQITFRQAGYRGAEWAWVNRTFLLYRNGAPVAGGVGHMVTDVQPDPGAGDGTDNGYDTITFRPGLAQDALPGDVLVDADTVRTAWQKYPNGFLNIYDDGTVAPNFMGYDRLSQPLLGRLPELTFTTTAAEGVDGAPNAAHYQRITVPLVTRALSAYQKKHQRGKLTLCATSEVMDSIPWERLLTDSGAGVDVNADSPNMSVRATGTGVGGKQALGSSGFTMYHPRYAKNGLTWITDEWAPKSRLFGFDPSDLDQATWETWKMQHSGQLSKPSGGYYTDPNQDIAQIRFRGMKNRTSRMPQRCLVIDRIRQQTDVVRFS